jgi:hypothetical protein
MDTHQYMHQASTASTMSNESGIVAASAWEDELGQGSDELFFVSTYSDFEKLGEFNGRL